MRITGQTGHSHDDSDAHHAEHTETDNSLASSSGSVSGSGGHSASSTGSRQKPPQKPPAKPPTVHKPPQTESRDGCLGGRCCKGHQMYCKHGRTVYSYARTAIDRNSDGICDICKLPYRTRKGRLTARSAHVGGEECRRSPW
jgi:hypothetical protein